MTLYRKRSDVPRAQRGASRSLNLIIYELCRFIPAYKAGLSRHLPVKGVEKIVEGMEYGLC